MIKLQWIQYSKNWQNIKQSFQTPCLTSQGYRFHWFHCLCRRWSINAPPTLTSEQELRCSGIHGKHLPCSCWVIKKRITKELSWGTSKRGGTVLQESRKEPLSTLNLKDRVGGWVIRPQKESLHGVLKALNALAFKGGFQWLIMTGREEVRRTHASSLLSWDVLLCLPSCWIQPELEGKDPLLYPAKAYLLYCLQCKL